MANSNRIVNLSSREAIYLKAGEWIVRMESRNLSHREIDELREWLDESPRHRAALISSAEVWDRMDAMADLAELLPLDQPAQKRWVQERWARTRWVRKSWTKRIHALPAIAAMATVAAVAAMAVTAPLLIRVFVPEGAETPIASYAGDRPPAELNGSYATGIGELEEIDLVDGSRVTLNTATEISVEFGAGERAVHLIDGEAHFDVAHNETVPFVVYVDGTSVEAVGTAFSVRKLFDEVEVTVADGAVAVLTSAARTESTDDGAGEPIVLRAGQLVQLEAHVVTQVREYAPEIIARRLLWQESMLAFSGESLQEVVDEFERYTNFNLQIADGETAAIRVGGYFRSGDVPGLLTSLENNFSISVEQVSSDTFLLSLDPP